MDLIGSNAFVFMDDVDPHLIPHVHVSSATARAAKILIAYVASVDADDRVSVGIWRVWDVDQIPQTCKYQDKIDHLSIRQDS